MITGRIYANGYWEGLDAALVKEDPSRDGWVYVLAMNIPDPDLSEYHAIFGRTAYCHARIVTETPSVQEMESIHSFVYVPN